jgi:hypothetical protein
MGTCWFCDTRPTDAEAAYEVKLRGKELFSQTQKTGFKEYTTTTTYESLSFSVPRCQKCEEVHRKRMPHNFTIGIVFVLSIVLAFVITGSENFPSPIIYETLVPIFGCFVGIGLSVGMFLLLRKGTYEIKDIGHERNYPPIKEALGKGWTMSP